MKCMQISWLGKVGAIALTIGLSSGLLEANSFDIYRFTPQAQAAFKELTSNAYFQMLLRDVRQAVNNRPKNQLMRPGDMQQLVSSAQAISQGLCAQPKLLMGLSIVCQFARAIVNAREDRFRMDRILSEAEAFLLVVTAISQAEFQQAANAIPARWYADRSLLFVPDIADLATAVQAVLARKDAQLAILFLLQPAQAHVPTAQQGGGYGVVDAAGDAVGKLKDWWRGGHPKELPRPDKQPQQPSKTAAEIEKEFEEGMWN